MCYNSIVEKYTDSIYRLIGAFLLPGKGCVNETNRLRFTEKP